MSLLAELDRILADAQPEGPKGLAPDAAEITQLLSLYDSLDVAQKQRLWREAAAGETLARYIVLRLGRAGEREPVA